MKTKIYNVFFIASVTLLSFNNVFSMQGGKQGPFGQGDNQGALGEGNEWEKKIKEDVKKMELLVKKTKNLQDLTYGDYCDIFMNILQSLYGEYQFKVKEWTDHSLCKELIEIAELEHDEKTRILWQYIQTEMKKIAKK